MKMLHSPLPMAGIKLWIAQLVAKPEETAPRMVAFFDALSVYDVLGVDKKAEEAVIKVECFPFPTFPGFFVWLRLCGIADEMIESRV